MHASARSTKNILIWRWWWRTRTPPSGRSSSPLTSWPTSPSGCLWTGSTRDGKKDVLKITLTLDKIETHIKFCKVPTKPVTQPRVSEVIQCVINKSWHHAKSLKYGHELSKFYANQKGEKKNYLGLELEVCGYRNAIDHGIKSTQYGTASKWNSKLNWITSIYGL